MKVEIKNRRLERLETDIKFTDGRSAAVIRAFRKTLNLIRQAESSRDLYAFKSLRLEKLKGKKQHQHSMRLNVQYRLIVELGTRESKEIIAIIAIEDYHP